MNEPELLFETLSGPHGDIGLITLNRPSMLNALTRNMCIGMSDQIHSWEKTERIKAIVVRGAGERAFCAGGDIKTLYESRERPEIARQFFWHEYNLNHRIFHCKKPYIALLDGVTMGGGAGISIPGSFRVGTEKLKFAMPETGIGFFPDVGGSYYLSRCPGKTGFYLGLTGTVIKTADAYHAGLINYQVSSAQLPEFIQQLTQLPWGLDTYNNVSELLTQFDTNFAESELQLHQEVIDHCFAQTSVEKIIAALDTVNSDWTQVVVQQLLSRSPTSLKVVLEQIRRGERLDFDHCLKMEYRLANHFLHSFDFFEGVRAALIDKDKSPLWHPDSLNEVTEETVQEFFQALPDIDDLEFSKAMLSEKV